MKTPVTCFDLMSIGVSLLVVGIVADVRALVPAGVMFAAYGVITSIVRFMMKREY